MATKHGERTSGGKGKATRGKGERPDTAKRSLRGVKALVMGLGLHGGGVATAKWLASRGAKVTATDLRTKEVLAPSIAALRGVPVRYVLGRHDEEDFRTHDLIVANPGVPRESPFLAAAREAGKPVLGDAGIFFANFDGTAIAVTGTRGKTTTTEWIAALLGKKYPKVRASGNTPKNALLQELDRISGKGVPAVCELSSWQLEYLPAAERAPHIAIITNLYRDHLNRYGGSMEEYAKAKAGIFARQGPGDILILSAEDKRTPYFRRLAKAGGNPRVLLSSMKPLSGKAEGVFVRAGKIVVREGGKENTLFSSERFLRERGEHNLMNLLQAVLAVRAFDPRVRISERDALALPTPRMRQEVIAKKGKLTIVNDSCATSPNGVIAALERFSRDSDVVLITGGTDKDLDFKDLAGVVAKKVPREKLVLLAGSATEKLVRALDRLHYGGKEGVPEPLETLKACVATAVDIAREVVSNHPRAALGARGKGACGVTILFSPGGASFEKFLHEFDRGEKFARLMKGALRRRI
jgi:UDP-N-acetylmuramoylalanine--D-glutamate ligase